MESPNLNLPTFDIAWGGPTFPSYDGLMMAAGPGIGAGAGGGAGTGAGGGAGTGAGAGAGSSSSSTGTASGAGAGSPGSPSGATGDGSGTSSSSGQGAGTGHSPTPGSQGNSNDQNIANLRSSHELVTRLGGPQQIQATIERYNRMHTTASEVATRLGYTQESFEEAFSEAPAEIYNHLMQEAQQASASASRGGNNDLDTRLRNELGPMRQILQRQMAREANNLVDSEFNQQFNDHSLFKDKSVPADVKTAIYNHFTDLLKFDDKVQTAVLRGDTSGLKAHFDAAVANMIKFANSWGGWQTNSAGRGGTGTDAGAGAGAGAGTGTGTSNPNPFSLDDVIEGGEAATRVMPSLRGFRTA